MQNPLAFSLDNITPYSYQATSGSLADDAFVNLSITTDADSYFEILNFYGGTSVDAAEVKPYNCTFNVTHQATGRSLSNAAVPQSLMLGPGNRKVLERHPIIIPPNNTFQIQGQNIAGESAILYFGMKGYKRVIKPGQSGVQQSSMPQSILPFFYVVTASLAASQSNQVTLTMGDDSYFELYEITGQSDLDTASALINDTFAMEIKDQSSGRSYMSGGRVRERFITGPDNWAITERYPILFPPSMTLIFDLQNLSGASTNNLTIVLKGYKRFIV
jgi:hypothetical protein